MVGARQNTPKPEAPASAKETNQAAAQAGSAKSATPVATGGLRMLPNEPYNVEHWNSLDAEVAFRAQKIHRAEELPLENLATTIKLHDSVMTLDPLDFGIAGGHLDGKITMDGRQDPTKAAARLHARNILLAKMLPTIKRAEQSLGQMNGEIDLAGTGNAVNGMLATANGKVAFVIGEGKISKLLMETIGLHLPEIVTLKVGGDKIVGIRCGIADFNVKQGVMAANELVLDTEVTNISGTGTIDLAQEKMNLTLVPETKNTSLVALRAPIHVRGTFGKPEVGIDAMRVAARGLGAVALGLVNPLLALVPLVEPGPGKDSDCGRLIRDAKVMPGKQIKPRQVAVLATPSQVAAASP
jgi:AsmA protein